MRVVALEIIMLFCLFVRASVHVTNANKWYMSITIILNGSQLAKLKSTFRTCHCHEIYKEEAVGLKSSNCTLKIMIFVNM